MFDVVVTAASCMILTRRLCVDFNPLFITVFQMVCGGVFFLPFVFLFPAEPSCWTVDIHLREALQIPALLPICFGRVFGQAVSGLYPFPECGVKAFNGNLSSTKKMSVRTLGDIHESIG